MPERNQRKDDALTPVTRECPAAIACGDLSREFLEELRAATQLPGRALTLLETAADIGALIAIVARDRPRFILLPEAWLRHETLGLLDELAAAHRAALTMVVGADLTNLTLAHALRHGLRGVLAPDRNGAQLRRALDAIEDGELWVSRRRLLEALTVLTPPDSQATDATWRNLAALTERESAVLRETLDGKSNKQIARELELSEQTVKIHLQHIYQKLGVHRRLDLLKVKI
jgi:DNA-binding NarL/FixJ family response regulator